MGGACGKVCEGLVGGTAGGAGRGRDVPGWCCSASARVGKRSCGRRRSLKAASRTEQPVALQHPAVLTMSLRSNLSRLRTQVHFALKRSVHSVAVIGAPFSQGQVRTRTWHRGAGSPPSPEAEKTGVGAKWRGEDGEKRPEDVLAGSRDWTSGEHVGFSPVENGEGGRGWRVPFVRFGRGATSWRVSAASGAERDSGGSRLG